MLGAVAFALPLLLLVSGSFRQAGLPPPPTPELIPDPADPGNYARAVGLGGLARATLNSMVVAALAVPLSVLVASWAGFAMTWVPRRLTRLLVVLTLVALMVPLTALLVPRFAIFRAVNLTDTLVPLVAPALIATSPFYVLVFFIAFRSLPADLYDVCRLEEVSPLRTWWRVAMPLVRPVTVAVGALSFVLIWSSFLEPLVYLYDRGLFTVPLALRSLSTLDVSDYPLFLAGSVLASIPALLLFGVAQRRFLHQYRGPGWLGR
ncbi:MAG: carbohydrate ABC transporter permease [Actinomycetota bacterium]|nr:carbohydrate ABC transporter permease [Actinomycetota bacterium]